MNIFKIFIGKYPLRIHVWGGLGSQLHAIFLSERIKTDFPWKKISLVFHSSGVTKRVPDAISLFTDLEHTFIDDFVAINLKKLSFRTFRTLIKQFFLTRLHLIENCNNEYEYQRLRWWTLQTRGHYSGLNLNPQFSEKILFLISRKFTITESERAELQQSVAIHVRLGDLLEIESKNPTSFLDVEEVIQSLFSKLTKKNLKIYSDSPELALSFLKSFSFASLAKNDYQTSAAKSILGMVESSVFIGTGSKLSIWVAVLRMHVHPTKTTYLPSYLSPIIKNQIPTFASNPNLVFYQSEDK